MQISTHNSAELFNQFWQMVEGTFTNLVVLDSSRVVFAQIWDIVHISRKQFFDNQENTKCGLTLKCVSDLMIAYS